MLYLRLAIPLFFVSFTKLFAQSPIVRTYSFYVEQVVGNNFPDYPETTIKYRDSIVPTLRRKDCFALVYVETRSKHISWINALQNKRSYIINAFFLGDKSVTAGNLESGPTIIIKPSKGNFLWQIRLEGKKLSRSPFILTGRYNGKRFAWKTGSLKDLVLIPSL